MSWEELRYANPSDDHADRNVVYTPNPMIWGQPAGKFAYNPYRCAICGEIFTSTIKLINHNFSTNHAGFECQTRTCRKRFVDYNVVEVEHARSCRPPHLAKTAKAVWVCHHRVKEEEGKEGEGCEFVAETKEEMEEHAEKHEPFVCREKECPVEEEARRFKTYDAYKEHLVAAKHL